MVPVLRRGSSKPTSAGRTTCAGVHDNDRGNLRATGPTIQPTRRCEMADTAETYKGEFYCVKCKAKREAEGRVVETNGRRMAKGTCPVCGTNLNRILGKA